MTDSRFRVTPSPYGTSIILTHGPVTVFLEPDDAYTLIDDMRAALRALAESEASHE